MRGATGITLQPHQILCMPHKIALQNQRKICRNSWCVISNTRSIRAWSDHEIAKLNPSVRRAYFSPLGNAFCIENYTFRAPAIYPDFTEYCACHKKWRSKITKYCACHATWVSWLMSVTHNTSFTMRGAISITIQPHQMLPLPRQMMRIIDCRRICNVICNARSHRHRPPTSPNTAPATQKCTPKSKRNSPKTVEAPIPTRGRFDHDPNMNSSSRARPFAEVTFRASETHFVLFFTTFRAPVIFSNFTEYCACHEKWHSDITKYCACHEKWHSDITKCCTCHEKWHSDITKYCACHEKWHSDITKYCACHGKVKLLLNCYWTELLLSCYWAVTKLLLSCYWTVTELLLTLNWPVTEILLNWAVTELNCYWTVTQLLLNWPVTELSCYSTVTGLLLNCYWTDLLLNWAVTQLLPDCYWTDLLLNCYWIAFFESP